MKIISQNMLELRSGVLFHQVNCQGVMGGGIAAALAAKYQDLEPSYQAFCDGFKESELLGKIHIFSVEKDLRIANVFAQHLSSIQGSRLTRYDAAAEALERIAKHRRFSYSTFNRLPLYFPYKMGCGLGGGDWSIYSAIIDHYIPDAIICQYE